MMNSSSPTREDFDTEYLQLLMDTLPPQPSGTELSLTMDGDTIQAELSSTIHARSVTWNPGFSPGAGLVPSGALWPGFARQFAHQVNERAGDLWVFIAVPTHCWSIVQEQLDNGNQAAALLLARWLLSTQGGRLR